eukprot:gene21970-28443_t
MILFLSLLFISLHNIFCQQEFSSNVTYSLLIAARNEKYCGNSPERLAASLYAITEQLGKYPELQFRYEIIICDWNSKVPLTNSAYINSSEVHALNTAIRRASGEFLLRLDQDTIIGPNFTYFLVQALANRSALLSDDVIWWSSRRETNREDYEAIIQNPVQTILSKGRDSFPIYDFGKLESVLDGVGAVGVLGMSKRLWTSVEGYDERLTGYGHMKLELLERPEMKRKIYNLPLEYDFYHIWHEQRCKSLERPVNTHNFSARLKQMQDWGLGGIDLERCCYCALSFVITPTNATLPRFLMVRGTRTFAEADTIFRRIRQELHALNSEESALLHEDNSNGKKRRSDNSSHLYLWLKKSLQFPFGCRFKVNKFLSGVLKPLKVIHVPTLALHHIPEEIFCPDMEVGSALRINKSKQIYLFAGGSLRLFSSWSAFLNYYGGNISAVVDCPLQPAVLKLVNMGANV